MVEQIAVSNEAEVGVTNTFLDVRIPREEPRVRALSSLVVVDQISVTNEAELVGPYAV